MKKIVFAVILSCMPLFANADKVRKSADSQPEKTITVDVVKDKIKGELDSLMTYIKNTLNEDVKLKRNRLEPIVVDTTQFFYKNDSLALQQQNFRKITIKQVHKHLSDNETYKNEFSYGTIKVVSIEKDTIRDNRYHASVEFESRNIVKTPSDSLLSDARYDVKMKVTFMMAESKEKVMDENNKLTGTKTVYKVKKWTIKECNVNPKNYLSTEKVTMMRIAENAIKDWYENLPDKLDAARVEQEADVDSVCVRNMKVSDVQGSMDYTERTYTWKLAEKVTVDINPKKYVAGKEHLYDLDNLSASVTFTPEFTVVLSAEPYKVVSFNVDYTNYDVKEPSTKEEKAERDSLATEFIGNYITSLETYAAGDKTTRETLRPSLEAMFADGAIVEVSYFPRGGGDRKIERKVGKYLTLLKDAELTVKDLKREEIGKNVESITYSFTQLFKGKKGNKYSDKVNKVVKMAYQDDRWVITGITIDGNTRHK